MAYFDYNVQNEDRHQYLCLEFHTHFLFKTENKVWPPRQRGMTIASGPMYTYNPLTGERYYLQLLLTIFLSAISFHHIGTVDKQEYSTFKEACAASGKHLNSVS